MKIKLLIAILILNTITVLAQVTNDIEGLVIDKSNKQPLSFASLSLKKSMIGTITNENGVFQLKIPETVLHDTLMVSYLGFEIVKMELSSLKNGMSIELEPYVTEMEEIVIQPLTVYDYLERITQNINQNYSVDPFQTTAYYKESFTENDKYISNLEGIFLTYHPGCTDTAKNQHQLVILRQNGELVEQQFMNGWFADQAKKQEQRSIDNSNTTSETTEVDFGGPNTILSFDFTKNKQTFLDKELQQKYTYKLGETSIWQGEKVIKIYFETKRKVDNTLHSGYMLVDKKTYAIASIESKGEYQIPLTMQPVLFLMGISVVDPIYTLKVKYENRNGTWYPKDFHGHVTVTLVNKHLFKSDEYAEMEISQLYFINAIITEMPVPIPINKQYRKGKAMHQQVNWDNKTTWENTNKLSD